MASSSVYRHRTPWRKGRQRPLEKELYYTNTFLSCSSFSQAFPKEIYGLLSCDCPGRKNIIRLFRGLLNPEVTLIPGDLKCHCDQSSGFWRPADQWSFSSSLSLRAQWVLKPILGFLAQVQIHNWNGHTQQLAESPHWLKWEQFFFCYTSVS